MAGFRCFFWGGYVFLVAVLREVDIIRAFVGCGFG